MKDYDPPYKSRQNVYAQIASNISDRIEEAIRVRDSH